MVNTFNKPKKISKSDLYRSNTRNNGQSKSTNSKQQMNFEIEPNENQFKNKVWFSLLSQSKNQLNLEIISDTWTWVSNDGDDEHDFRLNQQNLMEGGD